ncbi:MAG: DUF3090 family protein [Acidimicrobiia bacterium]|nr:DUF3090 family protein [Acidimicrobiia bacterium]
MGDLIEWEEVDTITAGAIGEPGQRVFMIQARRGAETLSVVVEKEQVAILATEAQELLARIVEEDPPTPEAMHPPLLETPVAAAVPLFRARLIGLGYDPESRMVLIELREDAVEEGGMPPPIEESEGYVARLHATRGQVLAMTGSGSAAVAAGRPACSLCGFPMDPDGHPCPRWN